MLKRIYDKNQTEFVESREGINRNLQMESAYHHNAFEGNTLTYADVRQVVMHSLAVGNKTLREHFEIINYIKAMNYLYQQPKLNEQVVKQVHRILVENIEEDGGVYRTKDVSIFAEYHKLPSHQFLPTEMIRLFEYYENAEKEHPIDAAVTFHCRLLEMHPFAQKNELLAKLVLNYLLMDAYYPCIFIPMHQQKEYTTAIERAVIAKDYTPAIQLVSKQVEENLAKRLRVG